MGHIIKSDNVKLEGSFLLDVQQSRPSVAKATGADSAAAARIVENHPQFVVIEVACSCGATARLRCDYAPPK